MKPKVIRVNNQADMQAFLAVPSLVYAKGTVPPTADYLTTVMRFTPLVNPLLQHVRFANFVAIAGGKPVGRITATIDSLNPRPEEGFWGCFECIDDQEIAGALLENAAKWLKEQNKTVMIGPATLNTNEQVGLMIKGFEYEPQMEIPYNPPYYQKLVEEAGLVKVHDLECFKWKLPDMLPREIANADEIPNVVVRPVNYGGMIKEAKIIQEINNKSMSGIWGFIPMTLNDARGFLAGLARHVPPELFLIIEVDGEPAGMFLSIPYQKPNQKGTGGVLRLAIGGMVPKFRHKGIHWQVLKNFCRECKKLGFTEGEVSQVAESNDIVKRKIIIPMFGGEIIKLFRVYKRDL